MGKYNTERKHKEGQEMYKAVYHFILKYYRKHNYMPSTRNIADGLDISMATDRKHFNYQKVRISISTIGRFRADWLLRRLKAII